MMSCSILKWHTPKWIYQFSAEVLKIVVEKCALPTNGGGDYVWG
jgi:hypothetical protein